MPWCNPGHPNYQTTPMSYERTPEHRRLQSEAIPRWKPWQRSTGPRTPEGKAKSSRNGYKGGTRPLVRELARELRRCGEYIDGS